MTELLRDSMNNPKIPVQWTYRRIEWGKNMFNLHIQIPGHPGNRPYGWAFDAASKPYTQDLLKFPLETVAEWVGPSTKPSLAGTGKQYELGYLVYEGDDEPRLTTYRGDRITWPYLPGEGQKWLASEINLRESMIKIDEAIKAEEEEEALKAQVQKLLDEEKEEFNKMCQPTKTKGATMKTKKFTYNGVEFIKCRWILVDGFEKGLHIQVKGPEMNRVYGLSLTVPFSVFEDESDNYSILSKHVKGNTNSLRDGVRPYTKGGVCVTTNFAGQPALRFIASRKDKSAQCLNYVTKCCKVDSDVLDWIENN